MEDQEKMDLLIHGNSFWNFEDRKIELIDPTKIKEK